MITPLNIIFAGTPDFVAPTLQALIDSPHSVIAVYTQPDRPSGRGRKMLVSPIKTLALAHDIPVYQPLTLRDPLEQEKLAALSADVMIVVAYGLLLPQPALTAPRLGCINIHASLLPHWRGAAPIQRAILAGETQTGVTLMQMDVGLDTGSILATQSCVIEKTDTTQSLREKIIDIGNTLLLPLLSTLSQHSVTTTPQPTEHVTYAKKIEKEEAILNWKNSAAEIDCAIRAFNPWPIAQTTLGEHTLRIWRAQIQPEQTTVIPGTILKANKNGIDVATGNGVLRLLDIQLPNARCLPVSDILNSKADWFKPGALLGK